MFCIDERRGPTDFLRFRNDMETQGGFSRGFRTKNFHHSPARQPADPQGQIQGQRPRGHDLHVIRHVATSQFHNRAFPKLLFNLGHGQFQCFHFPLIIRTSIAHNASSIQAITSLSY